MPWAMTQTTRIKCRWLFQQHSSCFFLHRSFFFSYLLWNFTLSADTERVCFTLKIHRLKSFRIFCDNCVPAPIKRLNRTDEPNWSRTAGNCINISFFLRIFVSPLLVADWLPFAFLTCQRVKMSARRLTASTRFSRTIV